MHRILAIPELLDIIFAHLDTPSTAACAAVCKPWSDVALNALWADVDDLQRLIAILVPLTVRRGVYDMSRAPTPADWKRFEPYARRVRRLHHAPAPPAPRPSPTLFAALASTRLSMHILPHLHTLHWLPAGDLDAALHAALFLHPRLRALALALPTRASPSFVLHPPDALFDEVLARAPNLKVLDLRMAVPARFVAGPLCALLRALPALEKVVLPEFHITGAVLSTLSALPALKCIQFEYDDAQGRGDPADVLALPFSPSANDDGDGNAPPFRALRDLSLSAPLPALAPLLPHLARLTHLYIDSPLLAPAADVAQLLALLPESCPGLIALFLELLWVRPLEPGEAEADAPIWAEREAGDVLGLETLRPLLRLRGMKEFTLTHDRPLSLSAADIRAIARAWREIEVLVLACEPLKFALLEDEGGWGDEGDDDEGGPLGLEVLPVLARLCPKLKTLGLFLDAGRISAAVAQWGVSPPLNTPSSSPHKRRPRSSNPNPNPAPDEDDEDDDADAGPGIQPFRRLQKLTIGVSPIGSAPAAALALSHVLPVGCALECGVTWALDLAAEEGDADAGGGAGAGAPPPPPAAAAGGAAAAAPFPLPPPPVPTLPPLPPAANLNPLPPPNLNQPPPAQLPPLPTDPPPARAQTLAAVSARCARWGAAAALLPVLCQVRFEERERSRRREEEVEDLRVRCRVLMEMGGVGGEREKERGEYLEALSGQGKEHSLRKQSNGKDRDGE
ncbi:hypothetical protein HWV62_35756 [Athelia sp. TMB]|nr:hypothetical protein HWV62_35756 [Athelia sp. TMB]